MENAPLHVLVCEEPLFSFRCGFFFSYLFIYSFIITFSCKIEVLTIIRPPAQKYRRTKGLLMSTALHLSLKPQCNVSVSWQSLTFCTLGTGYLSFMWVFLQEFTSWFWFYCGLVLYTLNFIMCRLCVFVAALIAWPAVPLQQRGEFMCIPNK